MKTILSILALSAVSLVSLASPAHAFWVQAQAVVTNQEVAAQVNNVYGQPMNCRVQVAGMRNDGIVESAWVQLYIVPGQFEYAYVTTYYPFYFVNGQAQASCVFAY